MLVDEQAKKEAGKIQLMNNAFLLSHSRSLSQYRTQLLMQL
jgi:hypothetical protein